MNNEEKFFQPKYSLKKGNIFSLSELPDSLSEGKKSLGWPVEMQGTGRIIKGTNDFEIRYPKGDIFLSFGVVLHELGHLRQEEFNTKINKIDQDQEWSRYIEVKEKDAYQRGLERVKKYFPKVLGEMETKFQKYKQQGKLKEFSSFENLYNFLHTSIDINRAINSVPKTDNQEEQDKLEFQALKDRGIENFFKEIKESKVGEKIDKEFIEDFIMKMAEKISNE